jgi:cbb3-type cytochrome oxidase subunit 1
VLYIVAMWVSGITQGLMWRAIDERASSSTRTSWTSSSSSMPFYWIRLFGGLMYLTGIDLDALNIGLTIAG